MYRTYKKLFLINTKCEFTLISRQSEISICQFYPYGLNQIYNTNRFSRIEGEINFKEVNHQMLGY